MHTYDFFVDQLSPLFCGPYYSYLMKNEPGRRGEAEYARDQIRKVRFWEIGNKNIKTEIKIILDNLDLICLNIPMSNLCFEII